MHRNAAVSALRSAFLLRVSDLEEEQFLSDLKSARPVLLLQAVLSCVLLAVERDELLLLARLVSLRPLSSVSDFVELHKSAPTSESRAWLRRLLLEPDADSFSVLPSFSVRRHADIGRVALGVRGFPVDDSWTRLFHHVLRLVETEVLRELSVELSEADERERRRI